MNLVKLSSITKKVALASVGLFLVVFLLVHLAINLCLLRADNGAWFFNATYFMGTNYIVKVFEIVLFAAVLTHICLAIYLQFQNRFARPTRYKVRSKSKTAHGSRYMMWTGGLVLCFLALHFVNFYFIKIGLVEGKYMVKMEQVEHHFQKEYGSIKSMEELPQEKQAQLQGQMNKFQLLTQKSTTLQDQKILTNLTKAEIKEALGENFHHYEPDFYNVAKELFKSKLISWIYIFCFLALGFHLFHAVRSAFQTFGLNHNKYNGIVTISAFVYCIVIVIGFSIIPVYYMYFS